MNPVVRFVVDRVRKQAETTDPLDDFDDDALARLLFRIVRKRSDRGLRLTGTGLSHCADCFETFAIQLSGPPRIKNYLFLDRVCTLPYHIEEGPWVLTLFDRALALRLRLLEGNLDRLSEALF